jgi:radical SAM-linked protein
MHDVRRKNVPGKFRIRFSKTGDMRYLSHNELFTSIFRALKRANIPIAYSEGFHPRPKFSFGPALPSGVEGLSEFFEIELMAYLKPDDFLNMANAKLPDGLKLLAAVPVSKQEKSLSNLFSRYEYEATIDNSLINNVKSFMDLEHYEVSREKKTVDIRPMVESARIEEGKLHIVLADTEKANVRLYEALEALLQIPLEEIYSLIIKRTGLYGYNSDKIVKTERGNRICQAK